MGHLVEQEGKGAVPELEGLHPMTSGEQDCHSPVQGDSGPWDMGHGGGPGYKPSGAHRMWERRLSA